MAASKLFVAIQNLGQASVEAMTQKEIESAVMPVPSNAGMISRELKSLGWGYKPARGNGGVNKPAKSETKTTILGFSSEFADVMRQLVKAEFIGKTGIIANDDGTVSFDRAIAQAVESFFYDSPLDPDFCFITRHVPESDWTLAGIETVNMRTRRIEQATIAREKLEQAKQLVMASGFQLVKPESSALLASFMATEEYRLAEFSAMACQSVRTGLSREWRNEARKARLIEARRLLANQEAQAGLVAQAEHVAVDIQAAADQRIQEAMKAANDALAAKQASEQALQAMQAQMQAMQAQMQALMAAQANPTTKPQAKLKAVA